jgi:hypothetical protein
MKQTLLKPVRYLGSLRRPGAIAMFHIGRCGSTVMADLLSQTGKIFWAGEIYQDYCTALDAKGVTLCPNSLAGESPYPLLRDQMPLSGSKYFGYAVKFYNLRCYGITAAAYVREIKKMGITHFILLDRRNYLRKVVSSVVARSTGKYHVAKGSGAKLVQVKIDIDALDIDYNKQPLLDHLRGFRDDTANFEDLMREEAFLRLVYEDDIMAGPLKAVNRVCDFLQIPHVEGTVNFSRTTPFPLREVIVNFDEVAAALTGTEFAWMLND